MSNSAIHPARRNGFDVILGNPPWERVKLQEQEFFAQRDPAVAGAPNAAARKKAIAALKDTNPTLLAEFQQATRRAEGESHLLRSSGRYPLCGRGDINTYAVFAESTRDLMSEAGHVGVIVPSGIATDDTTKWFFRDLVRSRQLVSLFHFENEEKVFAGVHNAFRFALVTMGNAAHSQFVFYARRVEHLLEEQRRFTLSAEDFSLLNPNTHTCPTFRSARDAELNRKLYRIAPVLVRETQEATLGLDPWRVSFQAMFHMAGDSSLFQTADALLALGAARCHAAFVQGQTKWLPLYEAKMIWQFDHRFGTYQGQTEAQANKGGLPPLSDAQHADTDCLPQPAYWVRDDLVSIRLGSNSTTSWLMCWRDITGVDKSRTVVATVVPAVGVGHTLPVLFSETPPVLRAALLACLNSFVLDYAARQKVGGTHLTYGFIKQFPVLPPSFFEQRCRWSRSSSLAEWIRPRVLELVYTAHDLAGFARDLGYNGLPFRWDPARRAQIRAELDAAFFHLYGVCREDAAHIMDTFFVFKTRDEERHGGVYKTKETILALYDEFARAIDANAKWESALSPLPGDPTAAHTPETQAAARVRQAGLSRVDVPTVHTSEVEDQQAAVIAAFLDVRQGRSPDYVVCEPGMNAAFIAAARDRGASGADAVLNRMLLGARKTGVLSDHPTTAEYRMPKTLMPYAFVAEWAARHLQRQELLRHDEPPSLDDILCDPSLAARFVELASRIKPGIKPLDIRWAALGFRKTARKAAAPGSVTVEPKERVDAGAGIKQLPEKPGLYLIVAGQQVLYANYTRDLRDQLTRHAEVANGALAPEWLLPKQSRPDTVRWAWFQSMTPDAVAEARIHLVTEHRPWLNLLETGAA